MLFNTNGASERMRIASDGNVGIGVNNPRRLLHLESNDPRVLTYDIQSPISATRPAWEFGSSAGNYVIRSSADYTTFTPRLLSDNNGIVQLINYTTNGLL
ncbi:MAG: hypothetical protein AB7P01_18170 [Bacteroidia bacterium]